LAELRLAWRERQCKTVTLRIKELVQLAQSPSQWDLGNNVLYKLCRQYPVHHCQQAVIAKIWLIGRSYAAAIERRRKFRKLTNDAFYNEKAAPKIIGSSIDAWIAKAAKVPRLDTKSLPTILEVHAEVTNLFSRLSGLDQRALASKYLHFTCLTAFLFMTHVRTGRSVNSRTRLTPSR